MERKRTDKRSFTVFSMLLVGIPGTVWVTWLTVKYQWSLFSWLVLVGVALACARLSTAIMWRFFFAEMQRRPVTTGEMPSKVAYPPIFEYESIYDQSQTKAAEKDFLLHCRWQYRLVTTVTPPVLFGGLAAAVHAFTTESLVVRGLLIFVLISLLLPVLLYFARLWAAAKSARDEPQRHVSIDAQGIAIDSKHHRLHFAWSQFAGLRESDDYILLVVNPYQCLTLPKTGMPTGAEEMIKQFVQGTK